MTAALRAPTTAISHICIAAAEGCYTDSIQKRCTMFAKLNLLRKTNNLPLWNIHVVATKALVQTLKALPTQQTLLVIPAGESSKLDSCFTDEHVSFIKEQFLMQGGRGLFNCGSAYWVSKVRSYQGMTPKTSKLSLFPGLAVGPLCPSKATAYNVGFISDGITVTDGKRYCTIYNSGGGSFVLPDPASTAEKIAILARYLPSELDRVKKPAAEHALWHNAACMVSVGKGAALLSMFHPYYRSEDFQVEQCKMDFPHSATNWSQVKTRLSPENELIEFEHALILRLESMDFEGSKAAAAGVTATAAAKK